MAESAYDLQRAPLSTGIAPSNGGFGLDILDPRVTHDVLGPCEPTAQMAPRSV